MIQSWTCSYIRYHRSRGGHPNVFDDPARIAIALVYRPRPAPNVTYINTNKRRLENLGIPDHGIPGTRLPSTLLTLARACAAKGYCSRSVYLSNVCRSVGRSVSRSVSRSVCLCVCVCVCVSVRTFSLEPWLL